MRPQSHRRRFVNKILTLFKKTHSSENAQYPSELLAKYKISDKTLGVGSFAVVKQCTEVNSKEECAVKIILKKVIAGKRQMLDSEIDILKHVRHAHIVSMRDIYESEDAVYIVTDLCTGGELFQRIVERGTYTESIASDLVRQMLEGVSYLHSQDIVHRDMKPENLLFKTAAENSKLLITDFGLAKLLKNNNQVLTTACGTPGYVAPEVLMATGYGKPVDLWSVGVIMYTLLSGYTPFYGEDQTQLFDAIVRGEYQFEEEYWSEISEEAKSLIGKLLTLDPKKRITADEALQDPWIKGMSNTGINLAPNVRKGLHNHHDLKTLVTVITFVKKLKMVDELVTDAETDTHHSEIVAEDESQIVFNNDKNSAQVKNNGAERLIDPVTGDENRSIDGDTVQNNTEEPNITGAKMGKDNIVDDFKTMTEAQLGDMSDSHTTEQPITADSPASTPYRSENISVECTQTATAPALDALVKPAHNSSQNNEISNTFQETASPVNHNEGNVDSEGNTSNIKNTTNISNEQQKSIEEKNVENTIYDDAKGNIGNNSENQMKSTRVSR